MNSALGCTLALALLGGTGCAASGHGFNSVVAGVEQRYSVRAERVPLMALVSLCARATTHGGVRDMQIAQFHHIDKLDASGLDSMMESELGTRWQPMVKDWSQNGRSVSMIFVRPSEDSAQSMGMMIADYDNGELDLVRMEMNGSELAKWMQKPQSDGLPFRSGHSSDRQTD